MRSFWRLLSEASFAALRGRAGDLLVLRGLGDTATVVSHRRRKNGGLPALWRRRERDDLARGREAVQPARGLLPGPVAGFERLDALPLQGASRDPSAI